eukprot:jgi/Chlat1/3597/Chrsp234S03574
MAAAAVASLSSSVAWQPALASDGALHLRKPSSKRSDVVIVRPDSALRLKRSRKAHAGQRQLCSCSLQQPAERGALNSQLEALAQNDDAFDRPWDVLGLGQAMVDFQGTVGDELLAELGLIKGQRQVVDHEARGRVLQALDGCSYRVSAGGSLSNTLVALARLGAVAGVRVGMIASVGSDALGDFYRAKIRKAGVHFLSKPIAGGTTGTVVVLTTPDAQRTMLSYQGMSSELSLDEQLETAIAKSRVLAIEGYLWEIPQTIAVIRHAIALAKKNNVMVAMCTSDVSCVRAHRDEFLEVVTQDADILFANADEACALSGEREPSSAAAVLSQKCRMVAVTNGCEGSYLGMDGNVHEVEAQPCLPVDTCGAGDAYAAGALFGLLRGADLRSIGSLASNVASAVVAKEGARLPADEAIRLATSFEPAAPAGVLLEDSTLLPTAEM